MAAEVRREHALAVGAALVVAHAVEPGAIPGRGVAFDDERAHRRAVAIVVGDERAVLVRAEGERQALERRVVPYQANLLVRYSMRGSNALRARGAPAS